MSFRSSLFNPLPILGAHIFIFPFRLMGLKEAESNINRPPPVSNRTVQIDEDTLFHHSDSGRSSEQIVSLPQLL